jgi:hypothetical protein
MKATIALLTIACLCLGCGSNKTINGTHYETKGLFTQDEKDPCIRYHIVTGNVFWAILLSEMLFIPTVILLGWALWEPVEIKKHCEKGKP